jgi:hypothetical protein
MYHELVLVYIYIVPYRLPIPSELLLPGRDPAGPRQAEAEAGGEQAGDNDPGSCIAERSAASTRRERRDAPLGRT